MVIGAKKNMPHGLSVISVIWLPLKRRPLVLREIKKIVSSVRDKNNSQSDWREDFFITEETEIKRNNGKNPWDLCDL